MSMKMKKTAALAVAVMMGVFSLTGCKSSDSGDNADNSAETTAAPAAESVDVGYINPDWTYGQVNMGGGGFVTGLISVPAQKDLFFARTDVGGAYRWDESNKRWISLSYGITDEDVGLLSIDGLAVDPGNSNNVYMLAGCSYFSDGKTAILISHDCGDTFKQVEVTSMITAHGNGMGRQNGERIAVDPNNGQNILVGGRTGGIIRSTDGGETWAAVDFPSKGTGNSVGVISIVYDNKTPDTVYAGISDKGDNIFVSKDGGATWSVLPVTMDARFMPQRMQMNQNGCLLISAANAEGPWNPGFGGLYRYDPASGNTDDITPKDNPIADVAVHPDDPDKMVACTINRWEQQPNGAYGDDFYFTSDGGKTWTSLLEKGTMKMNANGCKWIEGYAIHWCGDLMIDPNNPDRLMVTSGNGVFACDNIWDDAPEFYFNAYGIEETVPLDIVSVKGGNLVSAIGDYDGFDHSDVREQGRLHTYAIGTTTGIDVAGSNHDVWVKCGGKENEMKVLYSENGGDSWTLIQNVPETVGGKVPYEGKVCLTADGGTIIYSPSNVYNTYYTTDRGETWTACEGISGGMSVRGDPVNPDYVYASLGGSFYVSSDGGKTFSQTLNSMSAYDRFAVCADKEGMVYVPINGLSVSTDHGETFTRIDTVKFCDAVGVGIGKTENDPYVIYMWGTPATEDTKARNLWMSEDEGKTWTRVNDDLHYFGGPGNGKFVVGDMNVYGRCYMSTVGLGIAYCDKTDKS